MGAATTKTLSKRLWKDINKLIKEKLPENIDLEDVDVDNLLTVMNYQEGIETQERVQSILKQLEETNTKVDSIETQIGNINDNVELLLKLLSEKK